MDMVGSMGCGMGMIGNECIAPGADTSMRMSTVDSDVLAWATNLVGFAKS